MRQTWITRGMHRLASMVRLILGLSILSSLVFVAPGLPVQAASGDLDTTFGVASSGVNWKDIATGADRATAVAIQSDGKLIMAGYSDAGMIVLRYSADGMLDTTNFASPNGYITTTLGTSTVANDVAVKTDGSILVAGTVTYGATSALLLAQFTSSGVLDTNFGSGGILTATLQTANTQANALDIQDDGMIVVAGSVSNDMFLARYDASGNPDTAGFNSPNGYVTVDFVASADEGQAVAIQGDGNILVAGFADNGSSDDFALARVDSSGAIDTTFGGGDGKVNTDFSADSIDQAFDMALQTDGSIVLAGHTNEGGTDDFAVARYTDAGVLDTTFSTDGKVSTPVHNDKDQAYGVAIHPGGSIVVSGFANDTVTTFHDVAVVVYTITGTLNTSFNATGIVTTDFGPILEPVDVGSEDYVGDVLVQPDGKIVVVGFSDYPLAAGDDNLTILRYLPPNSPPILTDIPKTIDEDAGLTFAAGDFTGAFSDPDGDSLSEVKITGLPPNGTLKLSNVAVSIGQVIPVANLGNLTYTPDQDYNGSDSFTWNASDGIDYAALDANVNVTINPLNDAPVLDPVGDKAGDEGTSISFTAAANDVDAGDILTFTLDSGAPAGAIIHPTDGLFSWIPDESQGPGTYTTTIRVSDSGTPTLDDFETITITVGEVNLPPVLDAIDPQVASEGVLFSLNATLSDPDLPANTFTYTLDAGFPSGAAIDPSSGQITWTPSEDQGSGTYTMTVRVADSGLPSLEDTEVFSVTVFETNSAPVLDNIPAQSVNEGVQLSFTATASDSDVPTNTLTYALTGNPPAGAAIDPDTGIFTWTPTEDQGPGDFVVSVRVRDNGVPPQDDTQDVNITVNEVNQPPVLDPIGNQMGDEGVKLSFTAHATDADIPSNNLTYSLESGYPAGASIHANSGEFSWTPAEDQGPGVYTITVTVRDSGPSSLSDSETIQVTVNDVNAAPQIAPVGNHMITAGSTLTITVIATDTDVPTNTLTYSLDPGAPAAAAIDPLTGVFSWTPEPSDYGMHAITVRVADDGTPILEDTDIFLVTVGIDHGTLFMPLVLMNDPAPVE